MYCKTIILFFWANLNLNYDKKHSYSMKEALQRVDRAALARLSAATLFRRGIKEKGIEEKSDTTFNIL